MKGQTMMFHLLGEDEAMPSSRMMQSVSLLPSPEASGRTRPSVNCSESKSPICSLSRLLVELCYSCNMHDYKSALICRLCGGSLRESGSRSKLKVDRKKFFEGKRGSRRHKTATQTAAPMAMKAEKKFGSYWSLERQRKDSVLSRSSNTA